MNPEDLKVGDMIVHPANVRVVKRRLRHCDDAVWVLTDINGAGEYHLSDSQITRTDWMLVPEPPPDPRIEKIARGIHAKDLAAGRTSITWEQTGSLTTSRYRELAKFAIEAMEEDA